MKSKNVKNLYTNNASIFKEEANILMGLLKQKFKSIYFDENFMHKYQPAVYFSFNDKADEAYFLLLSEECEIAIEL